MTLLSPRSLRAFAVGLLVFGAARLSAAPTELATLKPGHPRLIAGPDSWTNVRARAASDPALAEMLKDFERDARALLERPPETHRKTGRRLLDVSREVLRRTLILASAYRLTGDTAFLRRAEQEMLAVAAFSDWNPSHFLDVGEMTTALALGYDWLYADLSPEARATIRKAIVAKGLTPAKDPKSGHNGWQNGTNNWNQVCWGGMVLGSLAIGDEEPELAATMLGRARKAMGSGLKAYAPDGVYPEGPGYWAYGTTYSVMTFAALKTALGTDWGLADTPGFLASAGAFLQMNAPTGLYFDYSDSGEGGSFAPAVFWFAQRTGDAGLVAPELARLTRDHGEHRSRQSEASRFMPLTALWWPTGPVPPAPQLPLRWHGDGPNPIAVFRTSWSDPKSLYLATKGGSAYLSHAHMDAGSFVFEWAGVRWARDLGMQNYESLESKGVDLWNRKQDSQRWTVFRLNNRSHNTLTIDGQLFRAEGDARIVGFSGTPENACALIDLSGVLAGQVRQARRGLRVVNDHAILVQDELAGLKPGADVCWTMTTGAAVEVAPDGSAATLRDSGQVLNLRVVSPRDARVSVISADPPADGYNAPNPNRRRVVVHVAAPANGAVTLAVSLSGADDAPRAVVPLAEWTR